MANLQRAKTLFSNNIMLSLKFPIIAKIYLSGLDECRIILKIFYYIDYNILTICHHCFLLFIFVV